MKDDLNQLYHIAARLLAKVPQPSVFEGATTLTVLDTADYKGGEVSWREVLEWAMTEHGRETLKNEPDVLENLIEFASRLP